MSDRLGGFAPDVDMGRPPVEADGNGSARGGRGRRGSAAGDVVQPPPGGGPPPPGAKEDPRAGGPRRSYHDIDQTAEGDVELSY